MWLAYSHTSRRSESLKPFTIFYLVSFSQHPLLTYHRTSRSCPKSIPSSCSPVSTPGLHNRTLSSFLGCFRQNERNHNKISQSRIVQSRLRIPIRHLVLRDGEFGVRDRFRLDVDLKSVVAYAIGLEGAWKSSVVASTFWALQIRWRRIRLPPIFQATSALQCVHRGTKILK